MSEVRDTIYLDEAARVVIPKRIRDYAKLDKRCPLEIKVLHEGGDVVICKVKEGTSHD